MSFITMDMAPTFPAQDIIEEFERLEETCNNAVVGFANLVYHSYHRGCLDQQVRCMVRYMYHCGKSFEEASLLFDYPLILERYLREEVERYWKVYLKQIENHTDEGDEQE